MTDGGVALGRRAARALTAALLATTVLAAGARDAPAHGDRPAQPEGASGLIEQRAFVARTHLVVAAHPLASQAGHEVLAAGGHAVDAAVAVQMVLTLVEPQSSGIGGGAFLLLWDGQRVRAYDGREVAPASADEKQFLDDQGRPLPFHAAVASGRAVGVPGVLRMLEMAHRRHGRLPWSRLIEPAITLAEQGFPVSPRLHALLAQESARAWDSPARHHYYGADGAPWPVGTVLRNPALAAVLRQIAQEGADALHQGPVAASIVAAVRRPLDGTAAPASPAADPTRGLLTLTDLAGYEAHERDALCHDWQPPATTRRHRLCGFPPPSSGHLAVAQILGILSAYWREPLPADPARPGTAWLHAYAEASRLAYADRARYVADPAHVAAPGGGWPSLLEASYLSQRALRIGPRAMAHAPPGDPPGGRPGSGGASQAMQPERGTSHLSIVDGQGHAVSMTSTIEGAFGARRMADGGTGLPGGFLLNNQLTDFSFLPTGADGQAVANRVAPGKRPRSSMSPTLVFDAQGHTLQMALGSPGGAMIIHFVAKTLLGSLAWGLDAQTAVELPNHGTLGGPVLLEEGRHGSDEAQALRDLGHEVRLLPLTSGLHAIERRASGWLGAADPRREGRPIGR